MSIKRLRRALKEINEIWSQHDNLNNWLGVIWTVQKQIDEIREKKYEASVVLNEVADILIILVRWLDKLGIDPEKLMLQRLETRHKGRTKEIIEKYSKMFDEEQRKQVKREELKPELKQPWYEAIKDRLTKLETDVAYMRGTLDEMKRHNSKVLKFLMGLVTALIIIIGVMVGAKLPISF